MPSTLQHGPWLVSAVQGGGKGGTASRGDGVRADWPWWHPWVSVGGGVVPAGWRWNEGAAVWVGVLVEALGSGRAGQAGYALTPRDQCLALIEGGRSCMSIANQIPPRELRFSRQLLILCKFYLAALQSVVLGFHFVFSTACFSDNN